MSNLTDLLTVALNLVFIFATVSFVASATTDGLSLALQWRENILLRGVKALLNDPDFNGLCREVYNDPHVNPRSPGGIKTEAELKFKPAAIDPKAFARALLEVLQIIPSEHVPAGSGGVAAPVPDGNVAATIERVEKVLDEVVPYAQARGDLKNLAKRLIVRYGAKRDDMEKALEALFNLSLAGVSDDYRRRTQLTALVIGFGIAAVLDLKPLPVGGFVAAISTSAEPQVVGGSARYLPLAVNLFEWSLVAISTLSGSQFWLSILKGLARVSTPGTLPDKTTAPPASPAPTAPPPASPPPASPPPASA